MLNQILQKRIQKELVDLERDPPPGITCYPIDDNITELEAYFKGPPDTPYEQGLFKLSIKIPDRYPFEPPQIKFVTSIYHPNIDDAGRICADILKTGEHGGWKPAINLSTALISLRQLLATPNPDDPLDAEIAREYKLDKPTFLHKAKELVIKYANEDAVLNQQDDDECMQVKEEEEVVEETVEEQKPRKSLSLSKRKRSAFNQSSLESQEANTNPNQLSSASKSTLSRSPSGTQMIKQSSGSEHEKIGSCQNLSESQHSQSQKTLDHSQNFLDQSSQSHLDELDKVNPMSRLLLKKAVKKNDDYATLEKGRNIDKLDEKQTIFKKEDEPPTPNPTAKKSHKCVDEEDTESNQKSLEKREFEDSSSQHSHKKLKVKQLTNPPPQQQNTSSKDRKASKHVSTTITTTRTEKMEVKYSSDTSTTHSSASTSSSIIILSDDDDDSTSKVIIRSPIVKKKAISLSKSKNKNKK